MTRLIASLSIALVGCATTAGSFEPNPPAGHPARLDLTAGPETASRAFPDPIDPRVPSLDRLSHAIRALLGEIATAELALCVSPGGDVRSATMVRGSSYEAFDHALLEDAFEWRFASLPGPDSVRSCSNVTVAYRPR